MSEQTADKSTTAANQHGPYAAPCVTGISPDVRTDLPKLGNEKRQRVLDVVKRK
jgi:hypothetical protein